MKNVLTKLTCLMVSFLVLGCAGSPSAQKSSSGDKSSGGNGSKQSSSSSSSSSSSTPHVHEWEAGWTYDNTNHWHACSGCSEKSGSAAHTFGEWKTSNLGEYVKSDNPAFALSTIKIRECSICDYYELDSTQAILPEIRFNFEATNSKGEAQVTDFMTRAKSTDTTRPTVEGKITIANAGDYNTAQGEELAATMKVRGNQTAGFDKKGFQIKFNDKVNLLGLNGGPKGKGFKKWVLLADAKDTTISRTALGLYMSKGVIGSDSNVWSSNFTPVSVYLNNQYWGVYMAAEQKEVKDGRIKLDEPIEEVKNPDTGKKEEVPIMTTDIGYNFELDYYAKNEKNKGADGDPTFSINYGNYFTSSSYNIESPLANSGLGLVTTYTMNSDINDSTAGDNQHTDETNSNQVKFIKDRLQALFNVLGEASKGNAKDIDENNNVVPTTLSVRETIEKNFDLNAWAEGFIINAVCLPPDVGYSSFYLSYDNTSDGDHKLRYDNPWDFDSNFGNRRAFLEKPDEVNTSSSQWGGGKSYDPYFMDRTANMWLNLLGKLDFFMSDYVIPKWKAAVTAKVFENMIDMIEVMYKYYEPEYQKNFKKWTTTQASDSNVSSYFNGDGVNSGELRKPFVNVNERKEAQAETINWLTKRVAYLNNRWNSK